MLIRKRFILLMALVVAMAPMSAACSSATPPQPTIADTSTTPTEPTTEPTTQDAAPTESTSTTLSPCEALQAGADQILDAYPAPWVRDDNQVTCDTYKANVQFWGKFTGKRIDTWDVDSCSDIIFGSSIYKGKDLTSGSVGKTFTLDDVSDQVAKAAKTKCG